MDPFDAGDFRCAIQAQRKKRPSEPTIDIEAAVWFSVMPLDPSAASRREPERRHTGDAPLASVAMSTQDQIDGVVIFQLIEDVGCMGQQEGKTIVCARRQTAQVGPMQGGIVDADNRDFAIACGNEGGSIDQEDDLLAVGEFAIVIDRHATVVIVVAQGDEDRSNLPQGGKKSKEMREAFRHIEQVAGDKDPVGVKFADGGDDEIVPWQIAIEMQIAQMYGSSSGQGAVHIGQPGNFVCGETEFPVGCETEEPVEGFAQTITDEGTGSIGPGL